MIKRLELERVSVRFGQIDALTAVDVAVDEGKILMLAGPNGSGKSTLIKVLLGLVRPREGTIKVDGHVARVNNAFKEQLGYLPEAVAFPENLTGRQVMRFFASARGVDNQRASQVLERVGLADAARRSVKGYSRGMKQRLGLGVAIISQPPLLVLDEPTGGLDQEGLGVLRSILTEWREEGRLVLMASHDLTLLERRVDEICLLRRGTVCALDTPAQLRTLAALPVRVELHLAGGAGERMRLRDALLQWGRARIVEDAGDLLAIELEGDDLLGLMDIRQRLPDAIGQLRVIEPGLDMVYEHLLREVA